MPMNRSAPRRLIESLSRPAGRELHHSEGATGINTASWSAPVARRPVQIPIAAQVPHALPCGRSVFPAPALHSSERIARVVGLKTGRGSPAPFASSRARHDAASRRAFHRPEDGRWRSLPDEGGSARGAVPYLPRRPVVLRQDGRNARHSLDLRDGTCTAGMIDPNSRLQASSLTGSAAVPVRVPRRRRSSRPRPRYLARAGHGG